MLSLEKISVKNFTLERKSPAQNLRWLILGPTTEQTNAPWVKHLTFFLSFWYV